jgi:hypothetical protein
VKWLSREVPSKKEERELAMMLGMSLATFTLVHVLISLAGIASGFVVLFGFMKGHRSGSTGTFLATTIATSVTGFMFPFHKLLPSHIIAAISLIVLAVAVFALYSFQLRGAWRTTYVVTAALALYFNVFVLVAQSFLKVPALHDLAPKGSEPPFAVAQLIVLIAFVVAGRFAVKGFKQKEVAAFAKSA